MSSRVGPGLGSGSVLVFRYTQIRAMVGLELYL